MSSVGSELPREISRVATLLVTLAAGGGGTDFILTGLAAIDRAAEALATQDAIACVTAYATLRYMRL